MTRDDREALDFRAALAIVDGQRWADEERRLFGRPGRLVAGVAALQASLSPEARSIDYVGTIVAERAEERLVRPEDRWLDGALTASVDAAITESRAADAALSERCRRARWLTGDDMQERSR